MTLGSIGHEKVGEFITKQLRDEGLMFDLFEATEALTGQCAVTVMKADRTCIAVLDACSEYPVEHIEGVLAELEAEKTDLASQLAAQPFTPLEVQSMSKDAFNSKKTSFNEFIETLLYFRSSEKDERRHTRFAGAAGK